MLTFFWVSEQSLSLRSYSPPPPPAVGHLVYKMESTRRDKSYKVGKELRQEVGSLARRNQGQLGPKDKPKRTETNVLALLAMIALLEKVRMPHDASFLEQFWNSPSSLSGIHINST